MTTVIYTTPTTYPEGPAVLAIPATATTVTLDVRGAQGGDGAGAVHGAYGTPPVGGLGGRTYVSYAGLAGFTVNVYVGETGGDSPGDEAGLGAPGGSHAEWVSDPYFATGGGPSSYYDGPGGRGGQRGSTAGKGAGGGASSRVVTSLGVLVAVAGGGGGGGGNGGGGGGTGYGGPGGTGGSGDTAATTGLDGNGSSGPSACGNGGHPATTAGVGGNGASGTSGDDGVDGRNYNNGITLQAHGQGGNGGLGSGPIGAGGGGGGGGYGGGGGGESGNNTGGSGPNRAAGGGGGGSGFRHASATNITSSTGYQAGNGSVTIIYNSPPGTPGAYSAPVNGSVVKLGSVVTITTAGSVDPDSDALTYTHEYSRDGGAFTSFGGTTASTTHTPTLVGSYQYRYKATDPSTASSAYTTGPTITVVAGGPRLVV